MRTRLSQDRTGATIRYQTYSHTRIDVTTHPLQSQALAQGLHKKPHKAFTWLQEVRGTAAVSAGPMRAHTDLLLKREYMKAHQEFPESVKFLSTPGET